MDHANATFTSKRDYEIHIQKEHSDASKYLRSPELLKAGESTRLQSDRPCPICGKEMPFALDLQYHIALHLERLALYSLPRSTGREDDSHDASDWSDQVNGGRDSSKSELLSASASVDSVEEVGLEQRERVEDQSRSTDNLEGTPVEQPKFRLLTPIEQIERGVAHLDGDIKHQELTAASLSVQAKAQDHTEKIEAFLEDQVPSLDHENLLNSTTGSAQRGPLDIPWDQHIPEVRKLDEERKQRDHASADNLPNSAHSPRTPEVTFYIGKEDSRNVSTSSLMTERVASEDAAGHKASSSRFGKGRLNLLNPMSLLTRRRASQNQPRPEEVVSTPSLAVPAMPDDYDPRIRGKIVHDFSAPRPRRIHSYQGQSAENSPISESRPFEGTGRRASDLPGLADGLAKRNVPLSQHSPLFTEHLNDDRQALQPANKGYLHSFVASSALRHDSGKKNSTLS